MVLKPRAQVGMDTGRSPSPSRRLGNASRGVSPRPERKQPEQAQQRQQQQPQREQQQQQPAPPARQVSFQKEADSPILFDPAAPVANGGAPAKEKFVPWWMKRKQQDVQPGAPGAKKSKGGAKGKGSGKGRR